jgi:hypothetical protein
MKDNRELENGSNFEPENYTAANICPFCGSWVFEGYQHICDLTGNANPPGFFYKEEEWNRYIYSLR